MKTPNTPDGAPAPPDPQQPESSPAPETATEGKKDQEQAQEAPADSKSPTTQIPNPEDAAIVVSDVVGKIQTLSPEEQLRYSACEEVIASGWATYVQVGLALATIRKEQLYRCQFDNFDQYCRAQWDYGRRYVDQLIAAAQVFNYLRAIGSQVVPDSERQVRPLIGLTMEEAAQAWQQAVERAPGGKITTRLLKSVVRSIKKLGPEEVRPRPARANKVEKRKLIQSAIGELLMLIGQKADYTLLRQKVETLYNHLQSLLVKPQKGAKE